MARKRKLDETQNLLNLYLHISGDSEVPKEYHLWCFIALMAAAAGDRMGYPKFTTKLLHPNMYTMLVGPSGCGKGEAIDLAQRFLAKLDSDGKIHYYRGTITGPALIDHIAKASKGTNRESRKARRLVLVTPELSMAVQGGQVADMFVKTMTEFYTGGNYKVQSGTRMHGHKEFSVPTINWLAGSTKEWLVGSINKEAVLGGFFGRTVAVIAEYPERRVLVPTVPWDHDEVAEHIEERLLEITQTRGEFTISQDARDVERTWYETRPRPNNEAMLPFWRRSHDLSLKLAMLLSLCDSTDLIIRTKHMRGAQRLVGEVGKNLPVIQMLSYATEESMPALLLEAHIKRAGALPHAAVVKYAGKHGVTMSKLKEVIDMLMQSRQVKVERTASGAKMYVWRDAARYARAAAVKEEKPAKAKAEAEEPEDGYEEEFQ